jgi:GH3 auxin-responsive promoter
MDHADRLRLSYTEMLLRSYNKKIEQHEEVIAGFAVKLRNPRESQEATLRSILDRNAQTDYGRRHQFSAILNSADYRRRVPLVRYEDLHPYVTRALAGEPDVLTRGVASYFSVTSGSAAAPKFIPGNQQTITVGCEAILVRNSYLRRDHPRAFDGTPLFIVGNANEGKTSAGIGYGAMTGFGYHIGHVGFAAPRFPYELFTIADYRARYYAILRVALGQGDLSAIFVYNPSTLLLMLERATESWDALVADIRNGTIAVDGQLSDEARLALEPWLKANPARADALLGLRNSGPRAWWPSLALLVCWKGGALGYYLSELESWIGDLPVRDLGVVASEAVLTIGIDDQTAGGVLLPESAFFEFVPIDGPSDISLCAWELSEGESYRVIVTTFGGLYRYDLGDVVRVERILHAMPVLSFLHRAGRVHSFTGEKLTELHVTEAVRIASDRAEVRLRGFTAVPVWDRPPRYDILVEPIEEMGNAECERLAQFIDEAMTTVNIEYASKRASMRLGRAGVVIVERGTYEHLRRARPAQDAQFKEIHLAIESGFAAALIAGGAA